MQIQFVSPLAYLNNATKPSYLDSDETISEELSPKTLSLSSPTTNSLTSGSIEPLGTVMKHKIKYEEASTSQKPQALREMTLSSPPPFTVNKNKSRSKRTADDRSPQKESSTKRYFKRPTDSPLPRVIKIHSPEKKPEDDEYFKRLASVPTASNLPIDSPDAASQHVMRNSFERTENFEETFIAIRLPPIDAARQIPEIVGIYPNTAEAIDFAYQSFRQPFKKSKIYQEDEIDSRDASLRVFGVEADGSRIFVYQKTFIHTQGVLHRQ